MVYPCWHVIAAADRITTNHRGSVSHCPTQNDEETCHLASECKIQEHVQKLLILE